MRIVSSSGTGAKIFALANRQLQDNVTSELVQQVVDTLKGKNLEESVVEAAPCVLIEQAKEAVVDAAENFARREVVFMHRQVQLKPFLHSLLDEWSLRTEALVREVGVRSGAVAPLWCENGLSPPAPPLTQSVSHALLAETIKMRASAQGFLPNLADQTSAHIQDVLTKRATVLNHLDRYARIETLFFMAHIGAGVEEAVLAGEARRSGDWRLSPVVGQLVQRQALCVLWARPAGNVQHVAQLLAVLVRGTIAAMAPSAGHRILEEVPSGFCQLPLVRASCIGGGADGHVVRRGGCKRHLRQAPVGEQWRRWDRGGVGGRLLLYRWLLSPDKISAAEAWVHDRAAGDAPPVKAQAPAQDEQPKKKGRKGASDMKSLVGSLFQ